MSCNLSLQELTRTNLGSTRLHLSRHQLLQATSTPYYSVLAVRIPLRRNSESLSPPVTGTEREARLEPTDSASYNDQQWTPLRSEANAWILSALCPEPRSASASIAWQK
jgi:hypothetical protein